jgi:dTDP-4-dehydrorhamnose 3,5-epimerase
MIFWWNSKKTYNYGMPFLFSPTELPEVVEITPKVFADERGAFTELFKADDFAGHAVPNTFKQVNRSMSKKDVLRGLHYQKNPMAQGKLISVVSGSLYDVAVDIRMGSPTFGKWVSRELSAEKGNMLYVPTGYAHGFCITSAEATVIYFCSEEYAPNLERGIMWNDRTLNINWPTNMPLLSPKDKDYPRLEEIDNNFTL